MSNKPLSYDCPVTGKHRYPSQYHAERKLEAIAYNPGQINKRPTRAYLCEHCFKWHLTSMERQSA